MAFTPTQADELNRVVGELGTATEVRINTLAVEAVNLKAEIKNVKEVIGGLETRISNRVDRVETVVQGLGDGAADRILNIEKRVDTIENTIMVDVGQLRTQMNEVITKLREVEAKGGTVGEQEEGQEGTNL